MGLGDTFDRDEEETTEDNGEGSVAYIYVRSDENKSAYNLMSSKLGGNATVRERLKNVPDELWTDQHDFFQQLIVALEPVLTEDDYTDLLDFLMTDAENIAQYLESNDEVREELIEMLAQSEEMQEAIEAND